MSRQSSCRFLVSSSRKERNFFRSVFFSSALKSILLLCSLRAKPLTRNCSLLDGAFCALLTCVKRGGNKKKGFFFFKRLQEVQSPIDSLNRQTDKHTDGLLHRPIFAERILLGGFRRVTLLRKAFKRALLHQQIGNQCSDFPPPSSCIKSVREQMRLFPQ